ncbi:20S proteasome component alpha 4 Pre6 [Schizosaccharomyces cryophilus OY26]|uniref:Proteasome subunit alpha type n=1 Tax=Schizosaccharomyces cryophilus (strain OY26 / ATCC MYA-4695 / CBS 11777 / NBRC 106824 / NRRL Y48691) TaxID=653667 RepID=S9XBD6_SCHCR|nr:20S proteasome component alpha 4 Pre6 [Schizosaccharomyces cryophilus OY26]EPY51081.1 20S proteasome component alpha 4 Pre6 [Schizosaccharomyces cryophilus OY26]
MSGYDRALSVFSPDGRLLQVEYGQEAVRRGTTAIALRGKDCIVIGVEKKNVPKLQNPGSFQKIAMIDNHVCLAFAGLNADARVLIDKARVEAQSHKLNLEDPVSVEYLTRYVAGVQQKYTQAGGVRPFGVSTLVAGFDVGSNIPRVYQTEPAGVYNAWKASAIGRSSKAAREFLEKNWKEDLPRDESIRLTINSLLEVVQTSAGNIELAILDPGKDVEFLPSEQIDSIVKVLQQEKEAEAARKKNGRTAASASSTTQS